MCRLILLDHKWLSSRSAVPSLLSRLKWFGDSPHPCWTGYKSTGASQHIQPQTFWSFLTYLPKRHEWRIQSRWRTFRMMSDHLENSLTPIFLARGTWDWVKQQHLVQILLLRCGQNAQRGLVMQGPESETLWELLATATTHYNWRLSNPFSNVLLSSEAWCSHTVILILALDQQHRLFTPICMSQHVCCKSMPV